MTDEIADLDLETEELGLIQAVRADDPELIAEVHESWGTETARVFIDNLEDTVADLHRVHSDATATTIEEADERAFEITKQAWRDYDNHLVLWTGGKDSTAMLHYLRNHRYVDFADVDVLFVDHGMHFEEVVDFVEEINYHWLESDQLIEARNEELLREVDTEWYLDDGEVMDTLPDAPTAPVAALPERQSEELEWAASEQDDREVPDRIPHSTNTFWGNHALKTIPLKQTIEDGGYDAVWVGIRKDEGEARAGSDATEPRENPAHTRVHPLVEFTEPQLWAYIKREFVPYCELYDPEFGYRSLGAAPFTDPVPNVQPLQSADQGERAGRAQNKEDANVMSALRDLGYM